MADKELSLDEVFGTNPQTAAPTGEMSLDEAFSSSGKSGQKEMSPDDAFSTPSGTEDKPGFVSRLIQHAKDNPQQAVTAGLSSLAEGGTEMLGGVAGAALASPAAVALGVPTAGVGGLAVEGMGMAGGSYLAKKYLVDPAERALGIDKTIKEAQAGQPELSTISGLTPMAPLAASSLSKYGTTFAEKGLGAVAKQFGARAAGGAGFEAIRYPTEAALNTITGSDETTAPITAQSLEQNALIGGVLGGAHPTGERTPENTKVPAPEPKQKIPEPEEPELPADQIDKEALDQINQITESTAQNLEQSGAPAAAQAMRDTDATLAAKEEVTATPPVKATPNARKEAEKLGVDLSQISPGPTGKITVNQVREAAKTKQLEQSEVSSTATQPETNEEENTEPITTGVATPEATDGESSRTSGEATDEGGVLPDVPTGAEPVTEQPPLVSSVDEQSQQGASAVTETPAALPTEEAESSVEEPENIPEHAYEEPKTPVKNIRPQYPKGATARTFVSPNTAEGLGVDQAIGNLAGKEHADLAGVADRALETLPVNRARGQAESSTRSDALGTWSDNGAENSILIRHNGVVDPEALRATAATLAAHGNQKQALIFNKNQDGADRMYEFTIPGMDPKQATAYLENWAKENGYPEGFGSRTLEQTPEGTKVTVVADHTEKSFDDVYRKVEDFANQHQLQRHVFTGTAEKLGDPAGKSRDEAVKHYAEIIQKYVSGGVDGGNEERYRGDQGYGSGERGSDMDQRHRHRLWELAQEIGLDVGDRPAGLSLEAAKEKAQAKDGGTLASTEISPEKIDAAESGIPENRRKEYDAVLAQLQDTLSKLTHTGDYSGYTQEVRELAAARAFDHLRVRLGSELSDSPEKDLGQWKLSNLANGALSNSVKVIQNRLGNEMAYGEVEHARKGFSQGFSDDSTAQAQGDTATAGVEGTRTESGGSGAFSEAEKEAIFQKIADPATPVADKIALGRHLYDSGALKNTEMERMGKLLPRPESMSPDDLSDSQDLFNNRTADEIMRGEHRDAEGRLLEDGGVLRSVGKERPVTPEMDRAYMDAVKQGDMTTVQKLVDHAARAAGFNRKAFRYDTKDPKTGNLPTSFDLDHSRRVGGDSFMGRGIYLWNSSEGRRGKGGREFYIKLNNPKEGRVVFPEREEKAPDGRSFSDATYDAWDEATRQAIAEGHDGFEGDIGEGHEIVVFDPNNIKSSDPVTYDDNGNVIPLSERFNPDRNDIRYRKGAPTESQERGKLIRTTYAEEVLHRIVEDPRNDSMAILVARHLLDRFGASGRLRNTPVDVHENLESGILGEYDPSTHRIALERSSDAETALEEVLHSLTADKKLPKEIQSLFEKIRKEAVRKGLTSEEQWTRAADPSVLNKEETDAFHYAFSNPHELLAAALKNREVRDALNGLNVRDSITGKLVNAWKQLKDTFKKMLGFSVRPDSALDQYLNRMFDHMSERQDKNALDPQGGYGVLYSNDKTSEDPGSGIKEPKIGFIYRNGNTNRDSSLRGSEGIRRLAEATTSDFATGQGDRQTHESLAGGFKLLKQAVDAENLHINPTFFKRFVNPGTELADPGAEHSVYFDPQSGRVIKVTHPDKEGDGTIGAKGAAGDYFTALLLSRELLGTDTHFEGLIDTGAPLPQIVTSQPRVGVRKATIAEIQKDLKQKGFVKKEARKDANIWTHKKLGVDIYDAVPSNVLRDADGTMHYIDVDLIPRRPVPDILADIEKAKEEGQANGSLNAIRTTKKSQSIFNDEENPYEYIPTSRPEVQEAVGKYLGRFTGADGNLDPYAALADLRKGGALISLEAKEPAASTLEEIFRRKVSELETRRAAGEYVPSNQITSAQRAADQAKRVSQESRTLLGKAFRFLKDKELFTASGAIDTYLKTILGGTVEDLTQGRVDTDGLKDGMAKIRQEIADVTVTSAKKLLGVFGISDEDSVNRIKTELGDLNSSPKELSKLVETLMGSEAKPEKVKALTQQLHALYNAAHARMAKSRVAGLVSDTYSGMLDRENMASLSSRLQTLLKPGRYNEDLLSSSLLDSLGITGYSPEKVSAIRDRVNEINRLPEGSDQQNKLKTQFKSAMAMELLNHRWDNEKLFGSNWVAKARIALTEMGPDLFRSLILTGPQTFMTHGFSGALNTRLSGATSALGYALSSLRKGGSFQDSVGYFKDFLDTMILPGTSGARNGVYLKEALSALHTGQMGIAAEQGIGHRGADSMAHSDFGGTGVGGKLFRGYAGFASFGGRAMMAFDAVNANGARELALRLMSRAALIEGGSTGAKLNEQIRQIFSPTKEEMAQARTRLQEEVDKGYFAGLSETEQMYSKAIRLDQLFLQGALPHEVLGASEEKAMEFSKETTLKGELVGFPGMVAASIGEMGEKFPLIKYCFPFLRILSTALNNSLEYTPMGFLKANNATLSNALMGSSSRFAKFKYKTYDKGSPEQIALMARSLLGTGAALMLTKWFLQQLDDEVHGGKKPQFMVYGQGPMDPAKRSEMMASGWRPGTVMVGNTYLPYKAIPGLDMIFTGLGALHDELVYNNPPPKMHGHHPVAQAGIDMKPDRMMKIALAVALSPLQHHFLDGAKNIVSVLYDGEGSGGEKSIRALQNLVLNPASQFTNPSIARVARTLYDGLQNPEREAPVLSQSSLHERMAQFSPFYFGYDKPSLNVLGDPIQKRSTDALTDRWIYSANTPPDPILSPLVNNGLFLTGPKKSSPIIVNRKGEMLTLNDAGDDAWRNYVIARGQFLKRVLTPSLISRLTQMDRLQAQSILDGPSIQAAANHYAAAVVERDILRGKIKVNS